MGFYCENCGAKVRRNSGSCPSCGVKFKAVRCPSCSYTDSAEFFKGGCPKCGYLAPEEVQEVISEARKKRKRGLLDRIPAAAFWAGGFLLLLLMALILNLLK
ncbi:MAG: zinc ribbon domain-containing protein [Spirochaetales bacterium]|nr:zinc ribbon domain-containing protein [Spirochaetales bacterium]